MFGLDTITWTKFITMLFLVCSIYYAVVFIRAWISRSGRTFLFENADETEIQAERLLPVSVSAQDYPGELIPFNHIEPVDLQVDYYGDNGIDEGYSVEQFYEDHLSSHPEFLDNIQVQS